MTRDTLGRSLQPTCQRREPVASQGNRETARQPDEQAICVACSLRSAPRATCGVVRSIRLPCAETSDTSVAGRLPESVKTTRAEQPRPLSFGRHNTPSDPRPEVPSVLVGNLSILCRPWMHPRADAQCHHCLLTSATERSPSTTCGVGNLENAPYLPGRNAVLLPEHSSGSAPTQMTGSGRLILEGSAEPAG